MPAAFRAFRVAPSLARNSFIYRSPIRRRIRHFGSASQGAQRKSFRKVQFALSPKEVILDAFKTVVTLAFWFYTLKVFGNIVDATVASVEVEVKDTKEEEEAEKGGESSESSEWIEVPDEKPEDALFIPLWLPRKIEHKKGENLMANDDSDLQAITKYADHNGDLSKQAKALVVKETLRMASQNAQTSRILGGNVHLVGSWIDLNVDYRKPKEYERFGLELTDEALYTVTRPMSAAEYQHTLNAVWPKTLALSFWEYGRSLYTLEKMRINKTYQSWKASRERNNGDPKPTVFNPPPVFSLQTVSASPEVKPQPGESFEAPQIPPPQSSGPPQQSLPANEQASKEDTAPREKRVTDWSLYDPIKNTALPLLGPGSDLSRASRAFMLRLMNGLARVDMVRNRSDIWVEGWVKLKGTRGEGKFEVIGFLDAKTGEARLLVYPRWTTHPIR